MPPSIHRRGKRQLNERFGEHRHSILNHQQLSTPTPVSLHFNQAGHSINDVHLILIELICGKTDSVRKAREAHLIDKANFTSVRDKQKRRRSTLVTHLELTLLINCQSLSRILFIFYRHRRKDQCAVYILYPIPSHPILSCTWNLNL